MQMKRVVLLVLGAAVLLTGCVVPGGTRVVATVPAPVFVRHVHGPHCGHLWGFFDGHPVYYHRGFYSFWNGGAWAEVRRPPVVYHHRTHQPSPGYRYHHRVYTPKAQPHPQRRYEPKGHRNQRHAPKNGGPEKPSPKKPPKHRATSPQRA